MSTEWIAVEGNNSDAMARSTGERRETAIESYLLCKLMEELSRPSQQMRVGRLENNCMRLISLISLSLHVPLGPASASAPPTSLKEANKVTESTQASQVTSEHKTNHIQPERANKAHPYEIKCHLASMLKGGVIMGQDNRSALA